MKKLSISELYETLTEAQVRNVLLGSFSNELKRSLSSNNLKANDLQTYAEEVHKQKVLAEKVKREQEEEERAILEQLDAEKKARLLAEAAARQEIIEEEKDEEQEEATNNLQPAGNQVVNITEENNATHQQVANTQVVQQNVTQVIVQQPAQEVPKRKELSIIEIQEAVDYLNKLFDKRNVLNEKLKALNKFINQPDSENNKFQLLAADDSYSFKTNSSEFIAEVQKHLQNHLIEKIKKLDVEIKVYKEAYL